MLTARSGLVLDPGSKVTYNGVEIGRVSGISEVEHDGKPAAKLTLGVNPKYVNLIPDNVDANIVATTVFGNKYVSFTSPEDPTPQRITSDPVIDATSVTTEFNTIVRNDHFDRREGRSGQAERDAVGGGGCACPDSAPSSAIPSSTRTKFSTTSIRGWTSFATTFSGWPIWLTCTPRPPGSVGVLGQRGDKTARTFNEQQSNLDAALMASIGFGNTGADILDRGGPFLVRAVHDLVPTAQLLDEYSPEILCVVRNYAEAVPMVTDVESVNGYAAKVQALILGAENPYVYPDNLPRTNARGGPGGRPGCWAKSRAISGRRRTW